MTFEPYSRPQPWGARNLEKLLGKILPDHNQTYGESWEISAQSLHVSRIKSGEFAGRTLAEIWQTLRPQIAGSKYNQQATFPWLIKYLDVDPMLSVQVHPNDQQAQQLLGEPRGKSEAVVILEASPDARIYAGFKEPLSREQVADLIQNDQLVENMHCITPRVGDCLYIPAGTIHASGGGVLFAEVQQTSDTTFRLYDWGRKGNDGKPRQLHIDLALTVLNYEQGPVSPVTPEILEHNDVYQLELLIDTPYFSMHRLSGDYNLTDKNHAEMQVIMLLAGQAQLSYKTGDTTVHEEFHMGQTLLLPRNVSSFNFELIHGQALLIR